MRIEAGSQEASFLSAFCPVTKVPTLVVIWYVWMACLALICTDLFSDGQLRESLEAGITREQFMERLQLVLQPQLQPETPPTVRDLAPGAVATHTVPAREPPTSLAPSSESPERAGQDVPPSTVQALLAERRERLEAQKKAQDAADKQERIMKAKARREAAEADAARAPPGSAKARDASYAQQQKKKQLEAKLERDRIMKLVENDKIERREREERRKFSAAVATGKSPAAPGLGVLDVQLPHETERDVVSKREFPIQIRLLDGSTIRTRFPPNATLRGDVRSWIDKQRSDGDTPYTFKQILTPLPNRAVTISEEEESLEALGLAPSATLVLVPIKDYTDAYRTGPGFLSGSISAGYNLVSSGFSTITTAFGTLLGIGPSAVSQTSDMQGNPPAGAANPGLDGNIRTLNDHGADADNRQLYNGNQVRYQSEYGAFRRSC
jgi:UBX domain